MTDLRLTKCELEIMQVVWQKGHASVQDVVDSLKRPLAYTTVMTTLNILVEKRDVLRRTKQGRAFIYEPTVSAEDVGRSMVGDLTEYLFGGSVNSLVLSLVNHESMTPAAIKELKDAIRLLESQT